MSNPRCYETQVRISSGFPTQVSGFTVLRTRSDFPQPPREDLSSNCPKSRSFSVIPVKPNDSNYAFVHHTGSTVKYRESQRLIKRHVMLDIGKSQKNPTKKRRQDAFEISQSTGVGNTSSLPQNIRGHQAGASPHSSISRFSTTRDPFMVYPIEMTRRTRALVDHLCSDAFPEMKPVREILFPLGLDDAAAFHQLLAVLAKHMPSHRSREGNQRKNYEKTEIMIHHAEAVKLIKPRMSNRQLAISDGTISAIVMMVCYSYMDGDFKGWIFHMNGLKRIIQHREMEADHGICGLNPMLRVALGWVDSTGSITQDSPPVFPFYEHLVPLYPNIPCPTPLPAKLNGIEAALSKNYSSMLFITNLFIDVAKYTSASEEKSKSHSNFWPGETAWSATYMEPLTYRLLSLRDPVEQSRPSTILQEIMRLSLLIYLGSIRRKLGVYTVVMISQLTKLSALLLLPLHLSAELDDLKLWILTIGAIEALETDMKDLLIGMLLDFRIHSLAEFEGRLKGVIWMEEIYGLGLRRLWTELEMRHFLLAK